jgi:hypothetical protein
MIAVIIIIWIAHNFFMELNSSNIMPHSISINIADIKSSISDLRSTVASLSRQQDTNTHPIANLKEHNEDIR